MIRILWPISCNSELILFLFKNSAVKRVFSHYPKMFLSFGKTSNSGPLCNSLAEFKRYILDPLLKESGFCCKLINVLKIENKFFFAKTVKSKLTKFRVVNQTKIIQVNGGEDQSRKLFKGKNYAQLQEMD